MTDLLAKTAELVAIPSLSRRGEGARRSPGEGAAGGVLAGGRPGRRRPGGSHRLGAGARLVLAGHLDTVPPYDNDRPRTEGGTLWGLGSTDMKGGLAVMVDLATSVPTPAYDVSYVFYVAEEIARAHNGLLTLADARPDLLAASAAIVCEPTDCAVEAGCQGVLKVEVVLVGAPAHVARPWSGRNAVHRLGPLLTAVAGGVPRR